MTDINIDALSIQWKNNPEPMKNERDPQTVVEFGAFAYIWNVENEENEWLRFDGDVIDIKN